MKKMIAFILVLCLTCLTLGASANVVETQNFKLFIHDDWQLLDDGEVKIYTLGDYYIFIMEMNVIELYGADSVFATFSDEQLMGILAEGMGALAEGSKISDIPSGRRMLFSYGDLSGFFGYSAPLSPLFMTAANGSIFIGMCAPATDIVVDDNMKDLLYAFGATTTAK